MFRTKTTFVIGAGASKDYNFPLGEELTGDLAKLLKVSQRHGDIEGDSTVYHAIRTQCGNDRGEADRLLALSRDIAGRMASVQSIDNFIEGHAGNEDIALIGKLGIVRAILNREGKSPLFVESEDEHLIRSSREKESFSNQLVVFNVSSRREFNPVRGTWLAKLVDSLVQGVGVDELEQAFENLSFVIFNYDRCVEHYLWHMLQTLYVDLSPQRASAILGSVKFFHPYGTAGRLPWQKHLPGPAIGFGGSPDGRQLLELAQGIKTFTEQMEDVDQLNLLTDLASKERVFFLGFGFLPQNMKLLTVTGDCAIRQVFGTAFGVSNDSCQVIAADLRQAFKMPSMALGGSNVQLVGKKAEGLFDEYFMRLTR